MTSSIKQIAKSARTVAAGLLLVALAACTSGFRADVSRFQSQLPAPQGQTFAVVADDPKLAGGLEFSQYADMVEDRMAQLGYTQADPSRANMLVRFDYGVDNGREKTTGGSSFRHDPFWDPWYGYRGYWGRSAYFRSRMWGYGWYDPFFDGGDTRTVYTSGISLKIDRAADGERLFEGKAEAVSTSKRLQYLVPNLVEAMFTDFPGNSGETVRITIAPEKAVQR